MVLPEPLSIFAITLGILGALNTARGSIQTIHDDVKSWKKAKLAIDNLSANLEEQKQSIEDWKEEWMVWEEDESLCEWLWGHNWEKIRDTLEQISTRSKELDRNLRKLSKSATRIVTKFKFFLWKKEYLQECMKDLTEIALRLHATTRGHFRTKHRRVATPGSQEIREIANLHQMVCLSLRTRDLSQTFYEACNRDRMDMVLDLELDFFGTDLPKERSKAISKFAATGKLNFHVVARVNQQSQTLSCTKILPWRQDIASGHSRERCRRSLLIGLTVLSIPLVMGLDTA